MSSFAISDKKAATFASNEAAGTQFEYSSRGEAIAPPVVKAVGTGFFGLKEKANSNKSLVLNLIDVFHKPPSMISTEYMAVMISAASTLGVECPNFSSISAKTGAVARGLSVNFVERGSETCRDQQMYTSPGVNSEMQSSGAETTSST
jgi:hypothetical protein